MQIRDARLADQETIVNYNRALASETEGFEIALDRIVPGVAAVLQDRAKGRYLLACLDEQPVGQLLLTTEWSDWRNAEFWWIQSVYVAPGQRGKGVFSALFRHIEKEARANADVCGLRLYVERDNGRASVIYRQLGMDGEHYRMMEIDFSNEDENNHA